MKMWNAIKRLSRDEQGAEMAEKILVISAVVLPLLALLIYFRDDIMQWVGDTVTDVKGDAQNYNATY